MSDKTLLDEAMINPASVFTHPEEVVNLKSISSEQKLLILKQWELDARELAVAEEEGMTGNSSNPLSDIIQLIEQLKPGYHHASSSPDKHGNIAQGN